MLKQCLLVSFKGTILTDKLTNCKCDAIQLGLDGIGEQESLPTHS